MKRKWPQNREVNQKRFTYESIHTLKHTFFATCTAGEMHCGICSCPKSTQVNSDGCVIKWVEQVCQQKTRTLVGGVRNGEMANVNQSQEETQILTMMVFLGLWAETKWWGEMFLRLISILWFISPTNSNRQHINLNTTHTSVKPSCIWCWRLNAAAWWNASFAFPSCASVFTSHQERH